jgi:hypothetical protein
MTPSLELAGQIVMEIDGDDGDMAGICTNSGEATQLAGLGGWMVYLDPFHLRSLKRMRAECPPERSMPHAA